MGQRLIDIVDDMKFAEKSQDCRNDALMHRSGHNRNNASTSHLPYAHQGMLSRACMFSAESSTVGSRSLTAVQLQHLMHRLGMRLSVMESRQVIRELNQHSPLVGVEESVSIPDLDEACRTLHRAAAVEREDAFVTHRSHNRLYKNQQGMDRWALGTNFRNNTQKRAVLKTPVAFAPKYSRGRGGDDLRVMGCPISPTNPAWQKSQKVIRTKK